MPKSLYALSDIVQAMLQRLPNVETVTDLRFVVMPPYQYVYFTYSELSYRVDQRLAAECVEGTMLVTDANSRYMQAILRGEIKPEQPDTDSRMVHVDGVIYRAPNPSTRKYLKIPTGETK